MKWIILKVVSCVFMLTGLTLGGSLVPQPRRHVPQELPAIRGELKVSQLDGMNICVTGYYQDFLIDRFRAECGPFLKMLERPEYKPQEWSRRFHYNFAAAEVIQAYRPEIVRAYQDTAGFQVKDSAGRIVPISRTGYWLNPVSAGRFPDMATGEEVITRTAEVTHHTYIEFSEMLKEGETYTLSNSLGEQVRFTYREKNQSASIKANQVGYASEAGRKYAYLGAWRGPVLKSRDYTAWIGKPFILLDVKSNREVFRGKIVERAVTPESERYSGEQVCEMDFSSFTQNGVYEIYVEGIGRSRPFILGNDALGKAFYIRARGMYHKRCGTLIKQPYSAWETYVPETYHKHHPDLAGCHVVTYQGNFPPNNRHYGVKGEGGFYDKDGKKREVQPFTLIREFCKAEKVLPDVCGGWHDAADYDRRPYHLECVGDFTAAYLMFPENFTDGQLNIPESGNKIPDILDEAIWGMTVWKNAQNEKGGVGCWIEADSHPGNYVPVTDEQPYYLALPTMESTANYAGYAAALALALKKAGAEKESQLFLNSALKAYEYATNMENRVTMEYKGYPMREGGKITRVDLIYRESDKLSGTELGKAAFSLYILTGKKEYLDDFHRYRSLGFEQFIKDLSWKGSPLYLAEFVVEGRERSEFNDIYQKITDAIIKLADTRLKELNENYQYRMPWYAPGHAYVSHTSWGNFQPLNRARPFIVAWKVTGDLKYRDAAFLCSDWQLGTNPTGSSMTTGLGANYPVRYLDLPSYSDHITEYVPGITPYRNTYGLARAAVGMAWGLFYDPRLDHQFSGMHIALLPKEIYPSSVISDIGEYSKTVGKCLPIWRRFANVEGWSVPVSEYTVSESLSAQAAVTGCLMRPGWMPSSEIKNIKPVKTLKSLPGLMALP